MIYLSVVIPAYNEEENIKRGVLEEVWEYLETQKYKWEVVLVDDGSTDKTLRLLEKISDKKEGVSLLSKPHRGKGWAIMSGIKVSRGKCVVFSDLDQSTPIKEVEKFIEKFEEGFGVVIGSRNKREGSSLFRLITGYGFILLRKLLLGLSFSDTQCGFKGFTRKSARRIVEKMESSWSVSKVRGARPMAIFDLEVLLYARSFGLRVAEVPVEWHYRASENFNPLYHTFLGLWDLIIVSKRSILGQYKV